MPQPLLGLALEVARKSWFFEWFHLEPLTEERPGHGQLVRFAPAGGAFHDLVALDLSLDADGRIAAASLGLDRRFIENPDDTGYAADITQSFLRAATPPPGDVARAFAEELAAWSTARAAVSPSEALETYLGEQAEVALPAVGCRLLLRNLRIHEERWLVVSVTAVAIPTIEHHTFEANGITLHYAGAGAGRPIVFLHGFPEFWYAWKDQLAEFGTDHRAIALDLRGYNLSSRPADPAAYRLPLLLEDLRALVTQLGAGPVTMVAHDWGGAIAWVFAMTYPDLLERLVIINAPHPVIFAQELATNPAQRQASQYMLFFRSPGAEAALSADNYARLTETVLADGLRRGYFTEDDRAAYLEAWSRPGALTGGLNYYRASPLAPAVPGQTPDTAPLPFVPVTLDIPTLVIWGMRDEYLLPGNLEGLELWVRRLTIERIHDADHWVVHQKPALVNALIRRFLAESRET